MNSIIDKEAFISDCGRYRYTLERRWQYGSPLLFIMLNPSTADAEHDDPTIRKCIGFAMRNGFNAIQVVNLFAYRATKPVELKNAGYPVGDLNDINIKCLARCAGKVVLAWGANARHVQDRVNAVIDLVRQEGKTPYVLKLTKDGIPAHPLMLPYTCQLTEYDKALTMFHTPEVGFDEYLKHENTVEAAI